MSIKRRKEAFGVNIGTSSLLLVFVVMCLVSFATLSIVSANADKKLNEKIIERTANYYEACNQVEDKLQGIDKTLETLYNSGLTREEYMAKAGKQIDFAVPVSDVQVLSVSLKVNYPNSYNDSFYTIEKWQLVNTGSLEEDDDTGSLNLIL